MARRRTSSRSSSDRGETVLITRSVLCTMSGISERQLLLWEHEDLIAPVQLEQVGGQIEALYDRSTLQRVRKIRTLAEELEVNLPGIGVILNLLDQMVR